MRWVCLLVAVVPVSSALEHYVFRHGAVVPVANSAVWPGVCVSEGGIDHVTGLNGEDGVYRAYCRSGWSTDTGPAVP